jgi:LuxR family transcriptional regulator, maltose regulon positive regulatory protein
LTTWSQVWEDRRGLAARPGPLRAVGGRRPLLERRRLLEVMDARFERSLTLLVAGPGFGKTTSLSQALERNSVSPRGVDLWLSCRAVHRTAPALARDLSALVGRPAGGETPGQAAEGIARAILDRAPIEVALVLDDVHHVPPGSSAAELLALLLDALPGNGHLVVASRVPAPLPVARLESVGAAAAIREDKLCFSPDELRELAALRSVPVHALEPSAGWPALAELAALRHGSLDAEASPREYVWEEVLARLPGQRVTDLAAVADLGGLDPELAAAAIGREVDLDRLLANLPLVVRSERRPRLHGLWRGVLAGCLDGEARAASRTRASEVLLGRGELEEAMRLLAGEGCWPAMRTVIRAACERGRTPVSSDVLRAWLDAVPPSRRGEPECVLLAALVELERGPAPPAGLLEAAAAAYRARGDTGGELTALGQWNALAFCQADGAALGLQVARLGTLARDGVAGAGPLARLGRGMLAFVRGDWGGALDALGPGPAGPLPGELAAAAAALSSQALVGMGEVAEAEQASRLALELAGPRYRRMAARAAVVVATAAGRWEEVTATVHSLLEGPDCVAWLDSTAIDHALATLLACRTGDPGAARTHLASAGRAAARPGDRAAEVLLALARADCALLAGDEDRARSLLRAELDERRLGAPGTHLAHLFHLALLYVLLPETRGPWDAADLPPYWAGARAIARALVALREDGDPGPAEALRPLRPELLRVHLPAPWAVELTVAGHPRPVEAGRLVERLGATCARWVEPLARSPVPVLAGRSRRFLASVPRPPAETVRLHLLGSTLLFRGDAPADDAGWRQAKVRELLAYLAIHPDAQKPEAIAALWPALTEEAGANNLRVTLWTLRTILEPERQLRGPSFFVRSDGQRLRLVSADRLQVDVWEFWRHLDRARRLESEGDQLDAYLAALRLRRGTFLDDLPDLDWAVALRADLDGRFVAAALRAGELLLGRDAAEAIELAGRVLRVDPTCERAIRLKVAAYNKLGARGAARRFLASCRQELRAHGVDPEPETEMLERLLGVVGGSDGSGDGGGRGFNRGFMEEGNGHE